MESDRVFVEICNHVCNIRESVIIIETQPVLSLRYRKHWPESVLSCARPSL